MKNAVRISRVILVILLIFLIHSCKKQPTPPLISTTAVTAISYTAATSGGEVTNEGGAAVTAKGVCWNTSLDPTTTNSKTTDGTGTGSFNSSLTGLIAGTSYYVRAYATNSAGTGYGNQVTFSTSQIALATLTTTAITAILQTTAVSGGNITTDNGGSVTARGVCWSTSANPTIALSTKTTDATGTGAFTSSITGLTANTTYYVKAYATNSAGTAYGNEISFKTAATFPTLTTTSFSAITATSAISGGTITSDGGAPITAKGVCWSTSQSPTIANFKTNEGTGTGTFTSSITGLTAGVTYYVRAYATNSAGLTAYGNQLIANGLTADINNLVPQSIIDELKRLGMPINTGVTPTTLNGVYNISPFVLINSNIANDNLAGYRYNDMHIQFSQQDNSRLTLRVDYVSIWAGTVYSSGYGVASFIVGTGNTFTVFVKVLDTRSSGETADLVYVMSGNVGTNSISNFYYANFMLDNHGYNSAYMSNGSGRVIYDSDGVSEKITSLKGAQIITKGNSTILGDPNGK